jgi:hypothetical protein
MNAEENRESKPEPPPHNGTNTGNQLLVWAVVASQFAPPFMFSGVAVALPVMGANLHAGATALSLVETVFLASQLLFCCRSAGSQTPAIRLCYTSSAS